MAISRQVERAEERAMLRRLLTKKDREMLSKIKDPELKRQIIAEIFNQQLPSSEK